MTIAVPNSGARIIGFSLTLGHGWHNGSRRHRSTVFCAAA